MNRDIIAFTKYKFNVYGNKDIRSGKDSAVVGIVGKSKSLDFPTMLIFWSLVRNSVVLAVYLLFSVACFFTVHEHFKMACRMFDPKNNHPMIFETAIISCTVLIMCPAMSFIAAFLYYPYYNGFNIFTLLANWIELICHNFPFAFFSQIFFIQPFVRWAFGKLFAKDIAARNKNASVERPKDETEAIADIFKRMDEIQERLEHERRQRKKLAEKLNNQ